MKIALVHDYLREYGGAERVVEVLHEMWPEAPLYTSFVDLKALGKHAERFKGWDIRTSWVQKYPFIKKYISPLRFLAPLIWGSFSAKGRSASGGDLSDYDVVISSSGWFMCKGVALSSFRHSRPDRESIIMDSRLRGDDKKNQALSAQEHRPLHISYIHHPPRNLYGYATGSDLQKYWPVRMYASIINFFLRHYDYQTAQAVDYFIANSQETARRVEKFYRRDSTVIYPPVEVSGIRYQVSGKSQSVIRDTLTHDTRRYYLCVGRLTYAKRVDLAIAAANKLKLPLKVIGSGKEEAYLRSIAGSTVEFLGSVSDEELARLYAGAKALIFCALDEDFGMVPVEAQSYGTPVIALAQGGVLETVIEGKTGMFFEKPEVEELLRTIQQFNKLTIQPKDCIAQAKKFSKERFVKELKAFIEKAAGS